MIDWRTSRFIILVLLLLTIVVGAGLAAHWSDSMTGEAGDERTLLIRFLDWWRREELLMPEVMARPARLPRFPVVTILPSAEPPFVPQPVIIEDAVVPQAVSGVVYCPPEPLDAASSPWCA